MANKEPLNKIGSKNKSWVLLMGQNAKQLFLRMHIHSIVEIYAT